MASDSNTYTVTVESDLDMHIGTDIYKVKESTLRSFMFFSCLLEHQPRSVRENRLFTVPLRYVPSQMLSGESARRGLELLLTIIHEQQQDLNLETLDRMIDWTESAKPTFSYPEALVAVLVGMEAWIKSTSIKTAVIPWIKNMVEDAMDRYGGTEDDLVDMFGYIRLARYVNDDNLLYGCIGTVYLEESSINWTHELELKLHEAMGVKGAMMSSQMARKAYTRINDIANVVVDVRKVIDKLPAANTKAGVPPTPRRHQLKRKMKELDSMTERSDLYVLDS